MNAYSGVAFHLSAEDCEAAAAGKLSPAVAIRNCEARVRFFPKGYTAVQLQAAQPSPEACANPAPTELAACAGSSLWSGLPDEVLLAVLSIIAQSGQGLEVEVLGMLCAACRQVCTGWLAVGCAPQIWDLLYVSRWGRLSRHVWPELPAVQRFVQSVTSEAWEWGDKRGKVPSAIGALSGCGIRAVSAGDDFAAAVTHDGLVYLWGDNTHGQCGVAADASDCSRMQTAIVPPKLIGVWLVGVACGDGFAAALAADGCVWEWGHTAAAAQPFQQPSSEPAMVLGVSEGVELQCGARHCVLRKTNHTVLAWGDNSKGQCGVGECSDYLEPSEVCKAATLTGLCSLLPSIRCCSHPTSSLPPLLVVQITR